MIYGTPKPRLDAVNITREGAVKLSVSKPWQPSRAGLAIPELLKELPQALEIPGYGLSGVGMRLENGILKSAWDYEGMLSSGATASDVVECGFEPEFGERSLLLHPDWYNLQKKYGGYVDQGTGRIIWPEWMPSAGYNDGLSGTLIRSWKSNPLYGRQTYLDLTGGTWVYPYVTSGPIEWACNRVGDVFKQGAVPGGAPKFSNRDYLKCAPEFKKRGGVYHVVERYKLSDVGGWPPNIYKNWT